MRNHRKRPSRYEFGAIHRVTAPQLARALHAGQVRKDNPNTPYVVHPQDVASILKRYGYPRFLQDAGWLHDALEDTPINTGTLALVVQDLRTYDAVVAVTNVFTKVRFPKWNRARRKQAEAQRLAQEDPFHRALKLADVMSNATNLVSGMGTAFARVYLEEQRDLFDVISISHGITSGIVAATDAALTREEKILEGA